MIYRLKFAQWKITKCVGTWGPVLYIDNNEIRKKNLFSYSTEMKIDMNK